MGQDFIRAAIGGIMGATLGAAVWVAVGQLAHAELGFLAVGVGFLAGFGVRKACANFHLGLPHGIIAAVCAIAAVGFGKYSFVSAKIQDAHAQVTQELPERDLIVRCVAQKLAPSNGGEKDADAVISPEFTKVAGDLLDQFCDAEKEPFIREARALKAVALGFEPQFATESTEEATIEHFLKSFQIMDLLWSALAVVLAVKIGSTDSGVDEDDMEEGEYEEDLYDEDGEFEDDEAYEDDDA